MRCDWTSNPPENFAGRPPLAVYILMCGQHQSMYNAPEARNYQASFNTAGFLVRALFAHRHPCDAGVTVTVFGGNAGTDES
ncbi:MAG: hypothetical protein O7D29_00270 [Gemmatimonadetes bacterium]|nr:hypothetical protein [Gemmatimonadota bacterium]